MLRVLLLLVVLLTSVFLLRACIRTLKARLGFGIGRWGHHVFEGDQDCDIESDIIHGDIQERLKAKGIIVDEEHMIDLFHNMEKPLYRPASSSITNRELRDHLNSLSDELFKHYRSKPDPFYSEYNAVILGAVMMKAGAKVSEEHRNFLRQAAGRTESYAGYRLPIGDMGFRDPGKAQFLAAVDNYEDGKPQDFQGPSCFRCGKINTDIAPSSLKKCSRCGHGWYCNRDCQKANWKNHKLICRPPPSARGGGFTLLNV